MFEKGQLRRWAGRCGCLALLLGASLVAGAARKEASVAELKAQVSGAGIGERPKLCLQIAELQLADADKLFAAGDSEKAYGDLADVVSFSEQARDYSIQARKHEKQSEIAVRKLARKLVDLKRAVTLPDQKPVQDAINRLERVRDDLLFAMFPKGRQ
jgi:hypothetical protein